MAEEVTEEQIREYVNDLVQKSLKESKDAILAEFKSTQPPIPEDRKVEQERKQIREYLDQTVGYSQELNTAKFLGADAVDQVRFYRNNPDAVDYEEQVEKAFQEAARNGRPTSRSDIYDWLVGKEARENPEKFQERQKKSKRQQVADVQDAVDVAAGATGRTRQQITSMQDMAKLDAKGNFVMPIKDMEDLLEGLAI